MKKMGFLFSGQGSQYPGMGIKLHNYSEGRKTFLEANDILKMDITGICCRGNDQALANTAITQPALLTCSVAAFRIIEGEGHLSALVRRSQCDAIAKAQSDAKLKHKDSRSTKFARPSAVAGLSVGEYSALVASDAISFADALKIVKERGRLMAEAAMMNPGIMVAILGLDKAIIESVCKEASAFGTVSPANYNGPDQIVISGEEEAVGKAVQLAVRAGAKKCVTLKVEGAFHSALMLPAETGLRNALSNVFFSKPQIPFISNVTGDYIKEPEEIRKSLAFQLSNSVRWEASINRMIGDGITAFAEIGPGKVLTGLLRRIYKEAEVFNSDDLLS